MEERTEDLVTQTIFMQLSEETWGEKKKRMNTELGYYCFQVNGSILWCGD